MLKIRLQRVGRKHETAFRLVLTDAKNSTKSGKFKEILGSYDPRKSVDALNADRIKYWLSVGASPSDTVHNLLVTHKIIDAKKKNVLPKKTAPVKEVVAEEAPAPEVQAEAPAAEPTEDAEITPAEDSKPSDEPAASEAVEPSAASAEDSSAEPKAASAEEASAS